MNIVFKTKESFLEDISSHAIDLSEEAKSGKVIIRLIDSFDSLIYLFSIHVHMKNGELIYSKSSKKVTFTKKFTLSKIELHLNAHLVGSAEFFIKIKPNDSLTWTTAEGQKFIEND